MSSSDDEHDDARAGDVLPRPLPDPVHDPAGDAPARPGAGGLCGDPGGPGGGTGTLDYERRDAGGAPVPLEPALVTLALLPRSQWQSLVHLDAIKARLLISLFHVEVPLRASSHMLDVAFVPRVKLSSEADFLL